jgi:hypothetical protein
VCIGVFYGRLLPLWINPALALAVALLGSEYRDMMQAALTVRFSDNPKDRLAAIGSLRDDVQGATPNGSVSVEAAVAKIRARRLHPA